MGEVECAAMRVRATERESWRSKALLGAARAKGVRSEMSIRVVMECIIFDVEMVGSIGLIDVSADYLMFRPSVTDAGCRRQINSWRPF